MNDCMYVSIERKASAPNQWGVYIIQEIHIKIFVYASRHNTYTEVSIVSQHNIKKKVYLGSILHVFFFFWWTPVNPKPACRYVPSTYLNWDRLSGSANQHCLAWLYVRSCGQSSHPTHPWQLATTHFLPLLLWQMYIHNYLLHSQWKTPILKKNYENMVTEQTNNRLGGIRV